MNTENPHKGYFRVYRSLWNDPLIESKREFTRLEAWLWLISTARSKKGEESVVIGNQVVKCSRGQVIRSLSQLAEAWRWKSKERASKFLSLLILLDRIKVEALTVARRITIVNYESYQDWKREALTAGERIVDDHETDAGRTHDDERTDARTYNTGESDKSGDSAIPSSPTISPSPAKQPKVTRLDAKDSLEGLDGEVEAVLQIFKDTLAVYPRNNGIKFDNDKQINALRNLCNRELIASSRNTPKDTLRRVVKIIKWMGRVDNFWMKNGAFQTLNKLLELNKQKTEHYYEQWLKECGDIT